MTKRTGASGVVCALGALCAGAIVAAFLIVGPPSQSAGVGSRVVAARQGVVQQTVSGSGSIEPATQLDLGFKTSGVVGAIHVSQGQYVTSGQLLAELDPQSAEAALEQSRASLQAAEANLSQVQENAGETSAGQSGGSGNGAGATASSGATTARTPSRRAATTTAPSTSSTSSGQPKESLATRDANLASAKANVASDRLAMQSAEQNSSDTRLFAPDNGTIVSLNGEVGETVSGAGTSRASSTSTSSASSGSGSSAASGAAGSGSATGGRASSSASSASSAASASAPFAVLSDLTTMQMVVPLSESEIVHVHSGQPATVTVEALEGAKLAAHVISVATLATNNNGVVSYDVAFELDQTAPGLKPGMSGSAEVVVRQQEGVNVPTSAISGSAVTIAECARQVRRRVTTGLVGNSTTIILSGLKAGEQVVLPLANTSSATSLSSRLAGGAGALGGGLGGGLGSGGSGRGARLGGLARIGGG